MALLRRIEHPTAGNTEVRDMESLDHHLFNFFIDFHQVIQLKQRSDTHCGFSIS